MLKDINKVSDALLDLMLLFSSAYFLSLFIFGVLLKIKYFDIIFVSLVCITLALRPKPGHGPKKIKRILRKPYEYLRKTIYIIGSLIVIFFFLNLYLKIYSSIDFESEMRRLEPMLNSVSSSYLGLVISFLLVINLNRFISEKIIQKLVVIRILVIGGLFLIATILFSIASRFLFAFSLISLHASYLINEIRKLLKIKGRKENIPLEV